MGLKLYYHPYSTYSRRVLIALIEKQIPCEKVFVDMAAGKHREAAYKALNPYGRVPTLEEDDFRLYESTAILNYLETIYPRPPLVPADAKGRAPVAGAGALRYGSVTRFLQAMFVRQAQKRFFAHPLDGWLSIEFSRWREHLSARKRWL